MWYRNAEEMETYDQDFHTASEKDVDYLGSWLLIINTFNTVHYLFYIQLVGQILFQHNFFILTIDLFRL